jgi:membrane protein implicated in regulation of membrane protease activity
MKDAKQISIKRMIMLLLILANIIVLRNGLTNSTKWYWALIATVPVTAIVIIYGRRWEQSGKHMNR